MFMVTNVEDWDAAMRVVERCREHLRSAAWRSTKIQSSA